MGIALLLAAGVAADISFGKYITSQNRKVSELSAQLAHQQAELAELQTKFSQYIRRQEQSASLQALNEVADILDTANLYLHINHDRNNAIKSLQLAQLRLQQLADPRLLPLQQALASDLNRLNETPPIDPTDILLRLQTLSESIGRLSMIPEPVKQPPASEKETAAKTTPPWYQQLWNQFKNLFVIHYQPATTAIIPINQREWLRENIAFTLAQAQWAVLQQKQELYQHSLTIVREWIIANYPDTTERKNIIDRLDELLSIHIAPNLPDINASLNAVQQALKESPALSAPPAAAPAPAPTPSPSPEKLPPPPPAGVEI